MTREIPETPESIWYGSETYQTADGSSWGRCCQGVRVQILLDGEHWTFTVSQEVPYCGRRVLVDGVADSKSGAIRAAEKMAIQLLSAQITIGSLIAPDRPVFGRSDDGWTVRFGRNTYQAKTLATLVKRITKMKSWEVV